MYERRDEPLLPRREFYRRLARNAVLALGILFFSLLLGVAGYHHFEAMSWIDSFANASMILSGMGPFGELKTSGGKVFAGCYALFSGVVLLSTIAVFLAPIVHRFMHAFHLEDDDAKPKSDAKSSATPKSKPKA
jgi:hypothetical protein